MSNDHEDLRHDDVRAARKTLTYAQALIAGAVSVDLLALERRYKDESFLVDLPIGDGLTAPLEVDLHPPELVRAFKSEALFLAHTVKNYLENIPAILRKAEHLGHVARGFARKAQEAGAPVTVGRTAILRQRAAWGFALSEIGIEFGFAGADLSPTSWWSEGEDLACLEGYVEVLAEIARPREAMRKLLRQHGATCLVDPVAHAAMLHFGINPKAATAWLRSRDGQAPWIGLPYRLTPEWRDGMVEAEFSLHSGVNWSGATLTFRKALPEAVLLAAAGRPMTDMVDHPVLAHVTMAAAESFEHGVRLRTGPLDPLLLMPDGSIVPLPQGHEVPTRREEPILPVGSPCKQSRLFGVFDDCGINDSD